MSTRTVAGKIEGLIEEASALEELGKPVQATDEATGTEAATELDRRYRTWYAASLSVLPDDLKEKFRFDLMGTSFKLESSFSNNRAFVPHFSSLCRRRPEQH